MTEIDYGSIPTLEYPIVGGKPRSPQWPKVEAEHKRKENSCRCCGTRNNLQVHHIKPYHKFPELELEDSNLMTVCQNCHFVICHENNWGNWVVDVEDQVQIHRVRVDRQREQRNRVGSDISWKVEPAPSFWQKIRKMVSIT